MSKQSAWMTAALAATLIAIAPYSAAQAPASGKPAGDAAAPAENKKADDSFDKDLDKARSAAEKELKQAQAIKAVEDKKKADEAAKQKQLSEAAETERKEREKEEAKRRAEEARLAKIEEKKRMQAERERSCVVKPVMSDAEIANCKKVWK